MGAGFGSTRRNTFDTRDALFRRSSQLRAAREVLVCFGLRGESLLCLFHSDMSAFSWVSCFLARYSRSSLSCAATDTRKKSSSSRSRTFRDFSR